MQDSKIGRAEAYARRAWDREGPCHTEKGEAVCVPGCCRETETVSLASPLGGSSERERAGGEELLFHHGATEGTEKGEKVRVVKKWDFFTMVNPGCARRKIVW